MLTVSHRHVLPYVCAACGYPTRAVDVLSGSIRRCPSCAAKLIAPTDDTDDDPVAPVTERISAADLAALRFTLD